jgi:hypothetical protein
VNTAAPPIKSFRPFLPSKDFAVSKHFYQHLGFSVSREWPGGAELNLESSSFILTDFYLEPFAGNFMMQLVVRDLDQWWQHIQAANLVDMFQVSPPKPPQKQSWGLVVAYVFDPSSVLWHVTDGKR